jgi:hypothetical protein
VRKEKDDFLAVHELAAANCLIRVVNEPFKGGDYLEMLIKSGNYIGGQFFKIL